MKFYTIRKLKIYIKFKKYSFILYILMVIILYILNMKYIYHSSYSKLAYSINIIYIKKMKKDCKKRTIIELDNLSSDVSKYIKYKYNNLFNLKQLHYKSLKKVAYDLKISGFISNIKHYIVNNNKVQYNIFDISINPILRKIIVYKFQRLQIPKNILHKYFQHHLGLPKNYQQLNLTINKIHAWYKDRGFNYINIDLIDNKSLHCLYIRIYEGIIINTFLNCNSTLNLDRSYLNDIENRIIKELSVSPGNIVNIKKIELGIKRLKKIRFISQCKYKIINFKQKIKVVILYDLNYTKINSIHQQYIKLCKTNIYYHSNLDNYAKDFYIVHQYYNYIKNFFRIFLVDNLNNYLFKNLGTDTNSSKISRKIMENNLSLRYLKLYKKNQLSNTIQYVIQFFNNCPVLNIFISFPNIKIADNSFIYTLLYVYKNVDLTNILYPIKRYHINSKNTLNRYNFQNQLYSQNISFQAHHNLFEYMDFSETINLASNYVNKNTIYIQRQYITNMSSKEKDYYILLIKKFKKSIKQKLLKLDIFIKNYDLYLTNYIKQNVSFLFQVQSIVYLTLSKINIYNLHSYFNQYMKIECYKSIEIPKIVPYIYKNNLIISLELHHYIHYIDCINVNWSKSIHLDTVHKMQLYSRIAYFYPKLSYLYHLEYHILPQSYYSLYMSYNYINKMNRNTNLQSFLLNKLNNYEQNIKYGIEFNMPIKSLPPLRLEYSINNQLKSLFQIRVYSKYKE